MDKEYIITDGILQHAASTNNYNSKFKYKTKYKSKNGNWVYVYDTPNGRIGTTNKASNKSTIAISAARQRLGKHVSVGSGTLDDQYKVKEKNGSITNYGAHIDTTKPVITTGKISKKQRIAGYQADSLDNVRKHQKAAINRSIRKTKIKNTLKKTRAAATSAINKGKKAASNVINKLKSYVK